MFRPIRRKKKEMDIDAAKELLQCSRRGVLAVNGDDGYPYAVPVNYFYDSDAGKIYFHGARAGHKVDALKASDKVCFTVYGNETIKRRSMGTVCTEHSCIWQMPSGRRRSRSNRNPEKACSEILSE